MSLDRCANGSTWADSHTSPPSYIRLPMLRMSPHVTHTPPCYIRLPHVAYISPCYINTSPHVSYITPMLHTSPYITYVSPMLHTSPPMLHASAPAGESVTEENLSSVPGQSENGEVEFQDFNLFPKKDNSSGVVNRSQT